MIAAYFTVEFLGMLNESIVHLLPKITQHMDGKWRADANGMLQNILSERPGRTVKDHYTRVRPSGHRGRAFFPGHSAKTFYTDLQICLARESFSQHFCFRHSICSSWVSCPAWHWVSSWVAFTGTAAACYLYARPFYL